MSILVQVRMAVMATLGSLFNLFLHQNLTLRLITVQLVTITNIIVNVDNVQSINLDIIYDRNNIRYHDGTSQSQSLNVDLVTQTQTGQQYGNTSSKGTLRKDHPKAEKDIGQISQVKTQLEQDYYDRDKVINKSTLSLNLGEKSGPSLKGTPDKDPDHQVYKNWHRGSYDILIESNERKARTLSFPRPAPGWYPNPKERFKTGYSWDQNNICIRYLSEEMLVAHDLLRKSPSIYIDLMEEYKSNITPSKSNKGSFSLKVAGQEGISVEEGPEVYKEAIKDLKQVRKDGYFNDVPNFIMDDRLSQSASHHMKYLLTLGSNDIRHENDSDKPPSMPWDRIAEFFPSELIDRSGENISQAHTRTSTAIEMILFLYVDDGVEDRGHRKMLKNRNMNRMGACVARRGETELLAVVNYVEDSVYIGKSNYEKDNKDLDKRVSKYNKGRPTHYPGLNYIDYLKTPAGKTKNGRGKKSK